MPQDYVTIDKSRFKDALKAYWLWKELNAIIKNSHNRGVNFPETISETLLCYALGFELNRGSGGDARNPDSNEVCEVKATSNWKKDTSSFSPSESFDSLYFVRLNQREDHIYIYDLKLNSEDLKEIHVSKKQTVGDQQAQKRRPRFSIIQKIIEPQNLSPIAYIDLRKEKIKIL
jgi:hypothetical protein